MGESWKNFEAQERKGPYCFNQGVGRNRDVEVASSEGSEGEGHAEETAV